ncbi:MAG: TlpA family protein disulfide reductase [Alphaproteobacteria bacterium]
MYKAFIIFCVAALGLLYAFWDSTRPPQGVIRHETDLRAQKQNTPAPTFTFTDTNGASHALTQFKGKTIILNFWATWCPPCVAEMPQLLELAAREKDNIVFIALSVDEQTDMVQRFFTRLPTETRDILDFENVLIGYDTDKHMSKDLYDTTKYPETYIISPDLQIKRKIRGVTDWLGDDIRALLTE